MQYENLLDAETDDDRLAVLPDTTWKQSLYPRMSLKIGYGGEGNMSPAQPRSLTVASDFCSPSRCLAPPKAYHPHSSKPKRWMVYTYQSVVFIRSNKLQEFSLYTPSLSMPPRALARDLVSLPRNGQPCPQVFNKDRLAVSYAPEMGVLYWNVRDIPCV